ncbi:nicotinate phosphoribosyltransferase [Allokutzneria albata]|uniref:Nicotinate phosphoribosyltransferase n=1 Tax=Allokutzneria albata TaxID=211114 RepID=A0A1G9SJ90_ALLAB|nr:nicotinate phosphoribosyltransferase [Allokutzneria albata]SDM35568.1 nicotinate phosphoribosyltransferase [Allokutzneria albata]
MSGLATDLYEIRMAVSYLRNGMTGDATFSLFARALPPDRGFLVSAGLADCVDFLESFCFTGDELDYLRSALGLSAADLDALGALRFTGDVWAVPEGRVVFAGEPLLEVTAPIAQAQLVETALLNRITFQTCVATKAARCWLAAPGAELVDFAARRTHGWDAAMAVARACAIGGFTGTSNVAAARRFGLRPVGTMAHSYVQAFPDERSAFAAFARDFPGAAVFLVDTYDTPSGIRSAIAVADERGLDSGFGVRLDSGDLGRLAVRARRVLDAAGLTSVRVMASGGLDEHALAELTRTGAPVDVYGLGTKVGVSADAPSLDSVYKLVAYDGRPVMKLSPGKVTAPGAKQVFRTLDAKLDAEPDLLALREEPTPPGREALMVPVLRAGERVDVAEPAARTHRRMVRDLWRLPETARRLRGPALLDVHRTPALCELTDRVRQAASARVRC